MVLDEAGAYALATWKRLEDHISDDVLRAVCGAFAIISVADGVLDRREVDSFLRMVGAEFPQEKLDLEDLERQFRDLADAMMSDPVAGRQRALREVTRAIGSEHAVELVRSAARLAVGADDRIVPVEVEALDAVCRALETPR